MRCFAQSTYTKHVYPIEASHETVFRRVRKRRIWMKRFVIVPFAVVALAVMLFAAPNVLAQGEAAPAKHTTKVGYLNCHVASGWGFIFGSSRKLQCVFTPAASGKKIEDYSGSITKFGADIGYLQS